ncbi:MAG: phage protease [bacterium]
MLQTKAVHFARELISQGKVDLDSPWSMSPEDENKLLGNPPDWEKYSLWFFIQDSFRQSVQTKEAYKYPYGKNGKVYRSALIAIRQRAGQEELQKVFDVAGELLDLIDRNNQANRVEGKLILVDAREGVVPVEIQLLPWGEQHTEKGDWVVDDASLRLIIADFAGRKNDPVIDYEHQSLGEGIAPAAGWIKKLINKGTLGLWAAVEWTQRAAEFIKNKEYRYLSPVFFRDPETLRVTRLVNAGLTNVPLIDGMVPLVNKQPVIFNHSIPKEDAMKKKLAALLGLKEDAPDEEFIQVISARMEAAKAQGAQGAQGNSLTSHEKIPAEITGLLGLEPGAKTADVAARIQSLKQSADQTTALAAKVTTLEEGAKKREAGELVEAAMKEGKVTPAQREWADAYALRDPEGFKLFVAKAPQIVPFDQIAAKGVTQADADREVELGKQIAASIGCGAK